MSLRRIVTTETLKNRYNVTEICCFIATYGYLTTVTLKKYLYLCCSPEGNRTPIERLGNACSIR